MRRAEDLQFGRGPQGKPQVSAPAEAVHARSGLHFNVSHTSGLQGAACPALPTHTRPHTPVRIETFRATPPTKPFTCKNMQEQIYRDKGDIVLAQAVQASASTRPISLSHGSELVCALRMAGLQGAPSAGTRWWGWTLRARSATCRGTRCGWLAASSRLPSLQSWKVQRPFCGNPLRDAPWSALPPAPLQAGPKDESS